VRGSGALVDEGDPHFPWVDRDRVRGETVLVVGGHRHLLDTANDRGCGGGGSALWITIDRGLLVRASDEAAHQRRGQCRDTHRST
jgi:hypothetical protein